LTEKELRKLSRFQLLELLIMQMEQNEKIQQELDALKSEQLIETAKISELGSVAEASLYISGIFKDAQKAADMYVYEAKKRAEEIIKEAENRAEEMNLKAEKEIQPLKDLRMYYQDQLRKKSDYE